MGSNNYIIIMVDQQGVRGYTSTEDLKYQIIPKEHTQGAFLVKSKQERRRCDGCNPSEDMHFLFYKVLN